MTSAVSVDGATQEAARVAADASVEVAVLDDMGAMTEAVRVFQAVWGFADGDVPVTGELLRAMAYAGGYVAGARRDGSLIGASAGFLGSHDGELHLHSHISGVLPRAQGRHVGLALKQHQRAWALARGIETIEWTFDPLVRRNAFFNLVKLGAEVVSYEPSFYGQMRDAINAGDETDRAVVRWRLTSPAAAAAARGEPSATADRDGTVILDASAGDEPIVSTVPDHGRPLRAYVPADVVALRRRDAGAGRRWRLALRSTFGVAVQAGYAATSMSRDGWYTLVKGSR